MFKKIIIGSILLALAGCAGAQQINIDSAPVQTIIAKPSHPRAPELGNVSWHVVTKDTLQAFVDQQTKDQGNANIVFFAINVNDYKTLKLNLSELQRYISQQNSIIVYYEKSVTPNTTSKKK